jgi:Na+/proline symporter
MAVFFWPRATTPGAITSILLGTFVTIAWQLAQQQGPERIQKQISAIDAVYPALAASVISLVVVSLLTRAPLRIAVEQLENT